MVEDEEEKINKKRDERVQKDGGVTCLKAGDN